MKQLILFACTIALLLTGCPKQSNDTYDSLYPKSIDKLLREKYSASITSVGIGKHTDSTIAEKKAQIDADRQFLKRWNREFDAIADQLPANIKTEMNRDCHPQSGNFNITTEHETPIRTAKIETFFNDSLYESYILSYIPMRKAIDEYNRSIECLPNEILTKIKSTTKYNQLLDRMEQEEILLDK